MNRQTKIELLKNIASGKMPVAEAQKKIAVEDGRFLPLVGLDLKEFEDNQFDKNKLVFVEGRPAKILTEKHCSEMLEIYV